MKAIALLLSTAGILLAMAAAPVFQNAATNDAACATVRQALADSQRVGPGVKRKEVEKYFNHDGGLQFPDSGRYTHPRCTYLKLEVAFEAAPSRGSEPTSPDDTVRSVSKLYVDYPVKD